MVTGNVRKRVGAAAAAAAAVSLAVSLAVSMAVVVTGCGKRGSGDAAGGGGTGTGLTLGFSQEGAESGWRAANTLSIQDAAKQAGVDLKFSDSEGEQQKQIDALQSYLQQRVDVVAFSPIEQKGWDTVLGKLKVAHIPVICSDRNVVTADPSLQPTFIGSDFIDEGRRAGEWLAKKTGGKADIFILEGTLGSTPAINRETGFMGAIKAYPGMKVVEKKEAKFKRDLGKQVTETFLKSPEGQGVTAVYGENDDMALGAVQALQEAGKKPGTDVVVVSIDGTRDALQAIIDGKMNCAIECNPLLGPAIMDTAKKLKAGDAVPPAVISQEALFDDPAQIKTIIGTRKY